MITPHLWFDREAKEAAEFYVSLFARSRITHASTIHNTPSGDCDILSFEVAGHPFMAISAGPLFKFNPSISFMLNFDPKADADVRVTLDRTWDRLAEHGTILMPLQEYPFSRRYGWVQDRYGVSWQLILSDPAGEDRPFIVPSLLFVGDVCGRAEEATDYYISLFPGSRRGLVVRYPEGPGPDRPGTIMFTDFRLGDQWFAAMDSAAMHEFGFNEAISFLISCKDQAEIDFFWERLSAVPEAEQCGWVKDRYGLSWQVSPERLDAMMTRGSPEQVARVTRAFLSMKKYDLAALERAYQGAKPSQPD